MNLAHGLGLPKEALTDTGLPAHVVSTGVPQLMVPIRSLEDVHSLNPAALNVAALNDACRPVGTDCVLVFTKETESPDADVHVRVFAPALGVPEDPATGSANGALGAYLVRHRVIAVTEPTTRIVSEQGLEIKRPSRLHVDVDSSGEDVTAVRVGGEVVLVAEGIVRF
jgi:trans-2,3-dihydro-3-hydroxyanthranilate isomerase